MVLTSLTRSLRDHKRHENLRHLKTACFSIFAQLPAFRLRGNLANEIENANGSPFFLVQTQELILSLGRARSPAFASSLFSPTRYVLVNGKTKKKHSTLVVGVLCSYFRVLS